MFTIKTRPARAPAGSPVVGEATSLLEHLTGSFAARIAGLWPAPHAAFVSAPAERRHLTCIALLLAGEQRLAIQPHVLLEARLRYAIAHAAPGAPAGLRATLCKLGEQAWSEGAYQALLRLLATPEAAKALRHAPRLTAFRVLALSRLPEPSLAVRAASLQLTVDQAEALAIAHAAITRRRGGVAADRAARRWRTAGSAKTLFEAALDELHPELPPAPFPGNARLRLLGVKRELREAAIRYRNCVRTLIGQAAAGEAAFYEWTGKPGLIVQIDRDPIFGWRLEDALAAGNEAGPAAAQAAIAEELRSWGVHVGRTAYGVESLLREAQDSDFELKPEAEVVRNLFGVW